jgi:formylglycine-generating enzyme required for sulfatase activity
MGKRSGAIAVLATAGIFSACDQVNTDAGASASTGADASVDAPPAPPPPAPPAPLDAGSALDAGDPDADVDAGPLDSTPGCSGLRATCGATHDQSCCGSTLVPGGSFLRDNGVNGTFPATVSPYRLDTYEVTVGRFKKFLLGYPANMPVDGAGKNPNVAGDPGWDSGWNALMPATQAALNTEVQSCDAGYQTWLHGDDNLPMDCMTWYVAYAFCIWDGGRLPTELEWNFAAAGGAQQRPFPWSTSGSDLTIDSSYAVYDGNPPATAYSEVGAESPKGDARWGQADMAGNEWEWTRDWYAPYPPSCANCATTGPNHQITTYTYRTFRGGSAGDTAQFLLTSVRYYEPPGFKNDVIGARCAR